MLPLDGFTDADAKRTILRAIKMLAVATALALPIVWWKLGWQSALMLLVGAVISGSGLWEWLRLMTALMSKMDEVDGDGKARPMAGVLLGFFLRLGLAVGLLYGSLKFLDGSVYALVAGVGLGVFSLTFESLRLVKAWTA